MAYNETHGIVPQTISKPINDLAEVAQVVVDAENEQLEELVAQASN